MTEVNSSTILRSVGAVVGSTRGNTFVIGAHAVVIAHDWLGLAGVGSVVANVGVACVSPSAH